MLESTVGIPGARPLLGLGSEAKCRDMRASRFSRSIRLSANLTVRAHPDARSR